MKPFGLCVAIAALLTGATAYASTVIDTPLNPDIADSATSGIYPEGQTFVAPATDTFFRSLTYYVQGAGPSGIASYLSADLYAWDQNAFGTIGSSLWSSGPTQFFSRCCDWLSQITALTFAPDINLVGGSSYALVFTISGTGNFLLVSGNPYPDGEAIVQNNRQSVVKMD